MFLNKMGYELVRVARGSKGSWAVMSGPKPKTNYQVDSAFHESYEQASVQTRMAKDNPYRRQRHYTLRQLYRQTAPLPGSVCELGCFQGLSSYQIAALMEEEQPVKAFHIFDSFEGLSEFKAEDVNTSVSAEVLEEQRKALACSLENVQSHLSRFPFIQYHKGWVPERFHEVENESFSFVHIDLDLYEPILQSEEFFYPRLVSNGIMVFDDYGSIFFSGAKKAVDEFRMRYPNDFFLELPSGQAFLIKR